MTSAKRIVWLGTSLADLQCFPEDARRESGYQLFLVQQGRQPRDFKPIKMVGPGAFEIRIFQRGRAYRIVYCAALEEAVYVLHAFEKKERRTGKRDLQAARRRYKEMIRLHRTN